MTTSLWFLHHSSLLCSDCEGTIKYTQVSPAEKKKCSTTFTCKTNGVWERERGRVVGWFWHIFSVVIMDPSYRMICSSTWLTELSSINKHSTCRNTHSKFPLFSELRLDCGAWLTCSSALCPRKNKKELLAALFARLASLSLTSISGTPWVTFGAFGSLTDPHIFRDIKQKGRREDFCCACRVLTCTAEMHSPHLPCLR